MPHARNSRPDLVMDSSSYDDDEKQTFICLFCPNPSHTLPTFYEHILATHSIDLPPLLAPLSFYRRIRFINFCRARTRDGFGVEDVMDGWLSGGGMDENDELLVPVLADDAVLINLDDDEEAGDEEDEDEDGMEGKMDDEDEEEDEWDEEDDEEDAEDDDIESTVRQCQQHTQRASPSSAHLRPSHSAHIPTWHLTVCWLIHSVSAC